MRTSLTPASGVAIWTPLVGAAEAGAAAKPRPIKADAARGRRNFLMDKLPKFTGIGSSHELRGPKVPFRTVGYTGISPGTRDKAWTNTFTSA
jgi:hypothetical protein